MLKTQSGFRLLQSVKALSHSNDLPILSALETLLSAILVENTQHIFFVLATGKNFVRSIFSNALYALELSPFVCKISMLFSSAGICMSKNMIHYFNHAVLQSNPSFQGELK